MADWSVLLGCIFKMNLVISTDIDENSGFMMSPASRADSILIVMDDVIRWINERSILMETEQDEEVVDARLEKAGMKPSSLEELNRRRSVKLWKDDFFW